MKLCIASGCVRCRSATQLTNCQKNGVLFSITTQCIDCKHRWEFHLPHDKVGIIANKRGIYSANLASVTSSILFDNFMKNTNLSMFYLVKLMWEKHFGTLRVQWFGMQLKMFV